MNIPMIGYGTFKTYGEVTEDCVCRAIDAGYRLIDTAASYKNEEAVGKAVRKTGIPESELIVCSKVAVEDRGYKKTIEAFDASLDRLGMDRIGMYLVHWPANRKMFGDGAEQLNADTWAAMEEIYRSGRTASIGVCNYLDHHLRALENSAAIMPMIDQIEYHPGFAREQTVRYCREHGILVEAWGPLGRGGILNHTAIREIAGKHDKTPAQICIAWIAGKGIVPLPKTTDPNRMKENIEAMEICLSPEDRKILDDLPDIGGMCLDPDAVDF